MDIVVQLDPAPEDGGPSEVVLRGRNTENVIESLGKACFYDGLRCLLVHCFLSGGIRKRVRIPLTHHLHDGHPNNTEVAST